MAICRLCQFDNPDGSQFCAKCGNHLGNEILTPVVAPLVTPASTSSAAPASTPASGSGSAGSGTGLPTPPGAVPSNSMIPQSPTPDPRVQSTYAAHQGQIPQPGTQSQGSGSREGQYSKQFEQPNTIPFNDFDRRAYAEQMANPNRQDYESVCVLAFVFGLVGFLFNPLYLISLAAIILGIIGHSNNGSKASLGMAGWILGLCSLIFQIAFDFICAVSTCGVGMISIFF